MQLPQSFRMAKSPVQIELRNVTYFRNGYCLSHSDGTKEFSLTVFQKNMTFWHKFLHDLLLDVMRHSHAKFPSLKCICIETFCWLI